MNWFFIALINPIAHAVVNHFDKYLITRFVKGGSVGTLILFSALFSIVALPILFVIHPSVFHSVSVGQALLLMANGALLVVAIMFYLYALVDEEASYVAPFFQLIPVFGFIFGYMVLGEVLRGSQLAAGGLIVLGGIVLSLELSGAGKRLKTKLLLLMIGSSVLYAINAVIFKSVAVHQGFLDSLFWDMAGKFIFGVLLFFVVTPYRTQFISLLKQNSLMIVGLNVLNEIIALVGEVALVLAVLYAPVALVQSVAGLQPAFAFIIGILITVFIPRLGQESLKPALLIQKLCGIILMTLGVYVLQFY